MVGPERRVWRIPQERTNSLNKTPSGIDQWHRLTPAMRKRKVFAVARTFRESGRCHYKPLFAQHCFFPEFSSCPS